MSDSKLKARHLILEVNKIQGLPLKQVNSDQIAIELQSQSLSICILRFLFFSFIFFYFLFPESHLSVSFLSLFDL
jgi:hypothetical protein